MTRLLLLLLLAARLGAAPPAGPGPILPPGAGEAAWRPLFSALAGQGPVYSRFTERRWFGFRKEPVTLDGEMRLDPVRGLSLRYVRPQEALMVIDRRGIVVRDARGRSRELPADPRIGAVERALLPALRFDLAEVRSYFVVHAVRDGQDWRLDLEPTDPALRHALRQLTIEGTGVAVRAIEFNRSATQRVSIEVSETRTGAVFSPDELARYFR